MATETSTITSRAIAAHASDLGNFWATFASEWTKLTSLRSFWIVLGFGFSLSVASAGLASVVVGSTEVIWPERFHPATFSMIGNAFALIFFSVLGVMVMAGEYSSGMIRVTLVATPERGRVFIAKVSLVAVVVAIAGLLTTLGMLIVTQAVLAAFGMPFSGVTDPETRRLAIALGLTMPLFPVIGLALATLLRNTAASISATLALLWLPQVFAEFLPMWWRENIFSLLPGSSVDSLTLGRIQYSPDYSEPALAAFITVFWLVGIGTAGYVSFRNRDA